MTSQPDPQDGPRERAVNDVTRLLSVSAQFHGVSGENLVPLAMDLVDAALRVVPPEGGPRRYGRAIAHEAASKLNEQLSAKPEQINATERDDLTTLGLTVLSWYAAVRDCRDDNWLKIERGSALAKTMDDLLRASGAGTRQEEPPSREPLVPLREMNEEAKRREMYG